MDALAIIKDLFAHMEWADAMVWSAIRRLDHIDENLTERLQHLHGTQHAFLMIWRNQPLDFSNVPADVEQWARAYYAGLAEFLPTVDAGSLDGLVKMPWAGRYTKPVEPHPTTLGETFIQVASHSGYHRGQINTRLRQLGIEPPLVDYIAWLWQGRPAAAWPHPID